MALPAEQPDDLEAQIEREALIMHTAEKREDRLAAWVRLEQLHRMRSPERVAEMEREIGIR